jgi:uncharacterized protein (DUF697 family)
MAKLPLDPNKIWSAFKEIADVSDRDAGIILAGDPTLIASAQAALSPDGWLGRPWEQGPAELTSLVLGTGDVLVVLVHPSQEDEWARAVREYPTPLGAVVLVDDGPAATHAVTWYDNHRARVSFSETPEGWEKVWEAIVDVGEEHVVAFGRRFPSLRGAACNKVIRKTARQNGVVGALFIVPGTDMPVMTINQIKMVLSMAAIFGQEITKERALELVGVVGTGLGFRAVARQVLDFVPGPGWVFKGAIGYTGTLAMGEAAQQYFEHGAFLTPGRISKLVGRFRK